ncbi:MAG: response regulator [Polyangiales bacterium]
MEVKPASREKRERASAQPAELFTASDVARFCQVDLKTIHNWSDKGEIPHFRTPGRHLRFRRLDVLDFLRKYGYAIPDVLRQSKPRVVIVDADANSVTALKRALGRRFDVTSFGDPLDALVALASLEPDVLLLDLDMPGLDGLHFLGRLRTLEATAHIRNLVFTRKAELAKSALEQGALEALDKADGTRIRESLEQLTGLDR